MNFLPHNIIKYQIYLLQLENYNLKRFWKVFFRKAWSAGRMRQELVWTNKLKIVFSLALIIQLALLILSFLGITIIFNGFLVNIFFIILIIYLTSCLFGLWLSIAVFVISPLDYILKQAIIKKAKAKIKQQKNLKIIGITGSYGKTTMKEVIAEILSQKYKVLKTNENKNTPLGISRLIVEELNDEIDILIVEMGAYEKGDIKKLCNITQPDIAVLTGINESHLARFGNIENTIATKFEIVANAKEDAKIILNTDDIKVVENYEEQIRSNPSQSYGWVGKKVFFYSGENNSKCEYKIANKQFLPEGEGQRADILNSKQDIGNIKTPFLGEYIFSDIIAGIIVARELNLDIEQIRHGISRIKPIEHRLQKVNSDNGAVVIDDSYNGNPDGVREAIKVLAKFKNKRKIYITPGLVEAGEKTGEIHHNIGRQLSGVADKVILIRNSVTPKIEDGLLENGFDKKNIIWFDSATEMHEGIKGVVERGDVVLFQNDWTDNYS